MSVATRLRNSDLVKCNEMLHSEKPFWETALKRVVTGRSREYWGWPVWTSRKPGEIRRRRGKEHRIKRPGTRGVAVLMNIRSLKKGMLIGILFFLKAVYNIQV